MSGIAGIFYRKGRQVEQEQLDVMLSALTHRGPDGCHSWKMRNVGLVFAHLITTPEGKHESLPLYDKEADLVITADARIDNREELVNRLRLARPLASLADSTLICESYKRWGKECPAHLIGDFAFAIWDNRRQELFCARDHIGVRPLYYHICEEYILFASELNVIFSTVDKQFVYNDKRIVDYLNLQEDNNTYTFYRDIVRLPPAAILSVDSCGQQITYCWQVENAPLLDRPEDDNWCAERFKELFFEAVSCRMRSISPIGCNLSGGLDSSSVVCTAGRLVKEPNRLFSFAFNFDSLPDHQMKLIDEREYQKAVVSVVAAEHFSLRGEQCEPFEHLAELIEAYGQPFFFPHLYLNSRIWSRAAGKNIRVMLDGHDGDSVVSHGYESLQQLARDGRLLSLYSQVSALARRNGLSRKQLINKYMIYPFWRAPLVQLVQRLRWQLQPERFINRILHPEYGLAYGAHITARPENTTLRSATSTHLKRLTNPLLTSGCEMINIFASKHQIECRSPFLDRRLMEFCFRLPPEKKLHDGWTRYIMRAAMKDVLPEKVRLRVGKSDLSPGFLYNLLDKHETALNAVISESHPFLDSRVNKAVLREQFDILKKNPFNRKGKYYLNMYNYMMLATWLDRKPNM